MKILRKILIVFSVILLVIAAIGFLFFDSHIHAERSIVINVPRSELFKILNTHKTFDQWSPWSEKDPNMKVSFSGPESGVGAKYTWMSENKEVGKGSLEIVESIPDSLVRQQLRMMEGGDPAVAAFVITQEGSGSKITWMMDMEAGVNPIYRIMGSFMDKLIGADFEKGLGKLKVYAESSVPSAQESANGN